MKRTKLEWQCLENNGVDSIPYHKVWDAAKVEIKAKSITLRALILFFKIIMKSLGKKEEQEEEDNEALI